MPSTDPQIESVDRTRRDAVERRVDALVLRRIDRLIGLDVRVALAVAVRVEHEHGPALRLLLVVGLVVDLRVEPAFDRAAAGEPQHAVVVEIQVMRAEAGVDRRDLLGLRIVQLHLPAALRDRKRDRGRMIRALLAERRRLVRTDARGDPDAGLSVHREAVRGGLAVQIASSPQYGDGRRRRVVRLARRLRIAHLQLDLRRRVAHRIDDRHVVGALFERAVDRSVRVDGRIAFVARDLVVQIHLRIGPVPHRDDDVALSALRPRGRCVGQLAPRDPIGPVARTSRARGPADLREARAHRAAGLTGLNAPIPRVRRRRRTCRGSSESRASPCCRVDGSPCSRRC